jgi:hypothetical protein
LPILGRPNDRTQRRRELSADHTELAVSAPDDHLERGRYIGRSRAAAADRRDEERGERRCESAQSLAQHGLTTALTAVSLAR